MIGKQWYYVTQEHSGAPYVIKTATVISETPRQWILRDDNCPPFASAHEPMNSFYDHRIPKAGEGDREGKNWRGYPSRTFFTTEQGAQTHLVAAQAQRWADRHRYVISQVVERIKDPALLAKVADLVGYPKGDKT